MKTYQYMKDGKSLKISYPNNFDIEFIRIELKKNNDSESFLLDINTPVGKHIKDFFNPIPIEVERQRVQLNWKE